MNERTRASWVVYVLGALSAGAIATAILVVGPASGSQATVRRTATAQSGVVQSTVSGSGNVQAASQLDLGFRTSGTVTHIYVTQGEQVAQGQLLATLDPQSAEVTLEQSKAALQSAEASLAKEEETDGETSAGQGSGGSGTGNATAAAAGPTGSNPAGPTTTEPEPTATTTAPAATKPATTAPTSTSPSKKTAATPKTSSPSTSTTTNTTGQADSKETSSTSKTSLSPATREANLASARAAVKSDKLTVQSDEQAVQDTKLYAPEDGTIVSLSGQVGETVSGSGTTKASSTSGSSASGAGSTAGAGAGSATSARTGSTGASSSSTSSSSSSSAFAVLSDLNSMQLVVPLSESEVGNVRDGQIATVTVEALESSKLAAHVREVAILSTSTSGAVGYDVTFQLDQTASGLKPGMSATAEVVVKQAEGVNVPTTAITGGSVTVIEGGKQVRRRVVTGLKGNSSTIILSGLKAGEKVSLPVATTTTSSSTRGIGGLGRTGALGGGGLPGGGAAFFRGGG